MKVEQGNAGAAVRLKIQGECGQIRKVKPDKVVPVRLVRGARHKTGIVTQTGGSGHQKVQVRGHAFPVGGQFDSSSAVSSSLNVTGRLSCGPDAAAPLPVLGPPCRKHGAALRSGSACHWMTLGF
jgi:hypothetical protein